MRYIVYLVAVLAAAGTVYYLGSVEQIPVASQEISSPAAASLSVADHAPTLEDDAGDLQTVSLKVPGMHCPMGCYPSVKKTLEGEAGVQGVDLVEQQKEGLIDNPVVIIRHDGEFDLDKAVASLEKRGFKGAAATTE